MNATDLKKLFDQIALPQQEAAFPIGDLRPWSPPAKSDEDHWADAMKYFNDALQARISHKVPQINPALDEYKDAELVMEMIRRGYAVLKCPEPGVPPETLAK